MRIRAALVPSLVLALAGCHGARESDATPQPTAAPAHDEQAAAAQTVVAQKGTPRGYDHPDQYLTVTPTAPAPNLEPVVEHPEQEKQARARLDELQRKFGRPPNIVVFLLDDIGWMDFGFNGGGIAVGNDTPHIDRIAADSLILTSAYSHAELLADARHHHDRAVSAAPRHPGAADVRPAGRPRGRGHARQAASPTAATRRRRSASGTWARTEGSQPQNVGFDDFRGFLSVSDMYTEWRDPEFNPGDRAEPGAHRVHGEAAVRQGRRARRQGREVETVQRDRPLDDQGPRSDVGRITASSSSAEGGARDSPFFLYYCTRGCHFDNYPNAKYAGRSRARTVYSDCIVEIDDIFARLIKALAEAGAARKHARPLHAPITVPSRRSRPMGARRFAAARARPGKAACACRRSRTGRARSPHAESEGLFYLADIFPPHSRTRRQARRRARTAGATDATWTASTRRRS